MINIHIWFCNMPIQSITFTKCKRLNMHIAFTPQDIHHQLIFRTRLFSLVSIMMLGCIDGSGWSSMVVNNATPLCPVLKHDKLQPSITPWKTQCGHIIEWSFFSKILRIYIRQSLSIMESYGITFASSQHDISHLCHCHVASNFL